jgi:hypothetical protein
VADVLNPLPKYVGSRSVMGPLEAKGFDSGVTLLRYQPLSAV